MLRFNRTLPTLNTVRRGAKATLTIPTNGTYRSIDFLCKNQAGELLSEAMIKKVIGEVRVLINGRAYWDTTAKHLFDLFSKYKDLPVVTGILHLPFTSSEWFERATQDNLGWGMQNVSTFEIELTINDIDEADNLRITGEAEIDNENRDLGMIQEIHTYGMSANVAGKFEVSDLPKQNGALIGMHIECADKIKGFEYKVDNVTIVEGDIATYNAKLKRNGKRVPQAGYIHHDPCQHLRLDDVLTLSDKKDIRYYLDMKEAQDLKFIMVTLSAPLGMPQTAVVR